MSTQMIGTCSRPRVESRRHKERRRKDNTSKDARRHGPQQDRQHDAQGRVTTKYILSDDDYKDDWDM